ncbi:MAG: hypothetical protein IH984_17025 [Planctomycetes bacterium]|nr:hypothetical protein [Planctomycetota bacterium]
MWRYLENRLKIMSSMHKSLFRYTYIALTTCICFFSFNTASWGQCEIEKLTAHDGVWGDMFGYSVCISGEFAIVGAYAHDGVGNNSGAAYIYRFDAISGSWIGQEKLTASDAQSGEFGDLFGLAVSINGDVAVISAVADNDACPGDPKFCNSGSAYIFRFDPKLSQWVEEDKLIASDGEIEDQFGTAVSINGDVVIVGVPFADDIGNHSGKSYIFRKDPKSNEWVEEAILFAFDVTSVLGFGKGVAVRGNLAIITSTTFDDDLEIYYGTAFVFRYNTITGIWNEEAKLTTSDAANGDGFGPVSISDDLAVIGVSGDDDAANNAGSAYVFKYDAKTKLWSEVDKIYASDPEPNDRFGGSVSISGDLIVVGVRLDDDTCPKDPGCDSGAAYLFQYDPKTDSWIEKAKLTASDPGDGDEFGRSVSISGNFAIVGSHLDDEIALAAGAAYTFDLSACLCPADLDGDSAVNTRDLLALFAQWGTAGSADLDGNGTVNTADLLILFANWGPCG